MTDLQLDLFEITEPTYEPHLSLADRAALFFDANPHVIDALERLAQEWFAAGHAKVGTKALWERLRWEVGIHTTDTAPKLNNSYTAFAARRLLARRPEWESRIETRRAAADEVAA